MLDALWCEAMTIHETSSYYSLSLTPQLLSISLVLCVGLPCLVNCLSPVTSTGTLLYSLRMYLDTSFTMVLSQ